ncbi:MAG: glycosyltransferase family 4 protein [Chloroflexi bacterium]|nr:glycosyltransferase family 4 protein [Chloroflexota bacterium]
MCHPLRRTISWERWRHSSLVSSSSCSGTSSLTVCGRTTTWINTPPSRLVLSAIGIDYTPAYEQGGGIGRYVRELVAALSRLDTTTPYRLFVAGAHSAQLPPPPAGNFRWKPTRLTPIWLARLWQRARLPLPVEAFVGPIKLYHATDFVLPPTLPSTRTLLTVHDLSFVRVPEAASTNLKAYLDQVVPRSVRAADHILADSQATKADLIELYHTPADKVTVLLSGVDTRFQPVDDAGVLLTTRSRYRLGAVPYIFSVGTVQPRKNYTRLIAALARLRAAGYDVHLVIAGGRGWLEDPIYASIRDTGMSDYVHFIGFADEADLPALYSAAACIAFPSLYEGFGLPVLEAMACGTPVVTSNVSSLPEVAGDAALIINPYDVDELTDALRRLLDDSDLRQNLVERGQERARQFTWDASARHLRDIYTRLLGG